MYKGSSPPPKMPIFTDFSVWGLPTPLWTILRCTYYNFIKIQHFHRRCKLQLYQVQQCPSPLYQMVASPGMRHTDRVQAGHCCTCQQSRKPRKIQIHRCINLPSLSYQAFFGRPLLGNLPERDLHFGEGRYYTTVRPFHSTLPGRDCTILPPLYHPFTILYQPSTTTPVALLVLEAALRSRFHVRTHYHHFKFPPSFSS